MCYSDNLCSHSLLYTVCVLHTPSTIWAYSAQNLSSTTSVCLPKKALGLIIPVRLATTIVMPVSVECVYGESGVCVGLWKKTENLIN